MTVELSNLVLFFGAIGVLMFLSTLASTITNIWKARQLVNMERERYAKADARLRQDEEAVDELLTKLKTQQETFLSDLQKTKDELNRIENLGTNPSENPPK